MNGYVLTRVRNLREWAQIRMLYVEAFPKSERKPFSLIRRMHREGKTDVWVLRRDGRFAGFATTINGEGLILIDYLAMAKKMRGQGAGSAVLAALRTAYPGCGLFVEIENAFEPGEDQPERQRRRAFYERCGFRSCRTMISLFGVPMELMGYGCTLDYETYHRFYCTYFSQWAGEHVKPLAYPEQPD